MESINGWVLLGVGVVVGGAAVLMIGAVRDAILDWWDDVLDWWDDLLARVGRAVVATSLLVTAGAVLWATFAWVLPAIAEPDPPCRPAAGKTCPATTPTPARGPARH